MKLRSGREVHTESRTIVQSSGNINMYPLMILSGCLGAYAGLMAFIFVNSSYYPTFESYLYFSQDVIRKELTDMYLFFGMIFSKYIFLMNKFVGRYLSMVLETIIIEMYGYNSLQCLSNITHG